MGFLGNIFNDVVDIVSAPVKIVTTVMDKTMETDITDFIDDVTDEIKIDNT